MATPEQLREQVAILRAGIVSARENARQAIDTIKADLAASIKEAQRQIKAHESAIKREAKPKAKPKAAEGKPR